jgi:hypothetical protein
MPRRYNPRAARNRLRALQAEIAAAHLIEDRDARRARGAVAARLRAVPGYARLRAAELDMDVQAQIDAIELRVMNAERARLGLEMLGRLPL